MTELFTYEKEWDSIVWKSQTFIKFLWKFTLVKEDLPSLWDFWLIRILNEGLETQLGCICYFEHVLVCVSIAYPCLPRSVCVFLCGFFLQSMEWAGKESSCHCSVILYTVDVVEVVVLLAVLLDMHCLYPVCWLKMNIFIMWRSKTIAM